jgi:hypothetical protein
MSDRADRELPATMLAALIAMLDTVVLERVEGGAFRQLRHEPSPSWFDEAFREEARGGPVTLLEVFPVLDGFLSEAEVFWSRMAYGHLEGEAVVVTGPGGRNLPLVATAVALEGHHFLLLQRVAGIDDRQHILQRARDQALEHERVVKQIDALRRPVERLTRIVREFSSTADPAAPHQGALASVEAELDTIHTVLEDLPKAPRGTAARRR